MSLDGGLNKEGEDLAEPLPSEWQRPEDLAKQVVTMHNWNASAPCAKIRAIMRFYNVPLGLIWGKSSGPYKKLPVLKVGDRQINDSHVIVKSLAPALIGRALSAAEVECERDTLTHGMQLTFEAEALATAEDLRKLSSNVDVWGVPTLTSIFADLISPVMSRGWARRHPNLEPAVHSARAFKRAFPADTLFYHGAAPGLLDVAAYGTLLLFVEPGMGFARRALAEAGLEAWYAKMRARLPPESVI